MKPIRHPPFCTPHPQTQTIIPNFHASTARSLPTSGGPTKLAGSHNTEAISYNAPLAEYLQAPLWPYNLSIFTSIPFLIPIPILVCCIWM